MSSVSCKKETRGPCVALLILDLLVTRYGYGHHIDTIHDERKIGMFLKVSIDSAT